MSYISDAYDKYLAELEAAKGRSATKFASSSCGLCLRRRVLRHVGAPGAPMTPEQSIRLREGTVLHEEHLGAGLKMGSFAMIEVDLAKYGFARPGWSGTLDAIGHVCYGDCGLGKAQASVLWERALLDQEWNDDLDSHKWEIVDYKTAHPGQVKYSDSLPKPYHCMQVAAYAEALHREFDVWFPGRIVYVAMGSATQPLEKPVDTEAWEPEVRRDRLALEEAAEAARKSIKVDDRMWPNTIDLPDPMPLDEVKRTEKGEKILFRAQNWECGYCEYNPSEWCSPAETVNKTGDRIGRVREDGTIVLVAKWLDKLGLAPTPGYEVE